MRPFEEQLPARFRQADAKPVLQNPRAIEAITPPGGFIGYVMQICANRFDTPPMRTKARELRMVLVAARFAGQHCLGEQPFPPERNETFGIKVPRMNCPKPHSFFFRGEPGKSNPLKPR